MTQTGKELPEELISDRCLDDEKPGWWERAFLAEAAPGAEAQRHRMSRLYGGSKSLWGRAMRGEARA